MIKITTKSKIEFIVPLQKIFGFRITGGARWEIIFEGYMMHEITEDEYNRVLGYWNVIW